MIVLTKVLFSIAIFSFKLWTYCRLLDIFIGPIINQVRDCFIDTVVLLTKTGYGWSIKKSLKSYQPYLKLIKFSW
jgi:hypothetical protein